MDGLSNKGLTHTGITLALSGEKGRIVLSKY